MAYGCFVDIAQQDGSKVRMFYPPDQHRVVKWIGIMEQVTEKYKKATQQPKDTE